MPRSLSRRVRVRHKSGAEKDVLRSKLPTLYGWERVPVRKSAKKRPPAPSPEVESTPVEPVVEPDASTKEE